MDALTAVASHLVQQTALVRQEASISLLKGQTERTQQLVSILSEASVTATQTYGASGRVTGSTGAGGGNLLGIA